MSFAGKEAQLLQKVRLKYTAKVQPARRTARDAGPVSADGAVSLELSPAGAQLDFLSTQQALVSEADEEPEPQ